MDGDHTKTSPAMNLVSIMNKDYSWGALSSSEEAILKQMKEALEQCENDEERKVMVNAVDQDYRSILSWAIHHRLSTIAREIISKDGVFRKAGFDNFFSTRSPPLHEACSTGNLDIATMIVTDGCKDDAEREKMVNMLNHYGMTILETAGSRSMFCEIMDPDGIIRKSGFNGFYQVNKRTGRTTLHYVAPAGDFFRLLYNHLKNDVMDLEQLVDALCAVDKDGETILHLQEKRCVDNIVEIFSAIVECFDRVSQDPSLSESAKEEMKNRLRELPFRKTNEGTTILAVCKRLGHLRAILESLMKHDEIFSKESIRDLVNAVDEYGRGLLFPCQTPKPAAFIEELILRSGKEAGFDSILAVDVDGNTALQAWFSREAMIAILNACKDDEEKMKLLQSKNHHGTTVFYSADDGVFISHAISSIEDLSLRQSLLMTMDDEGNIPLHCIQNAGVVEALIEGYEQLDIFNSAMNTYNKDGLSPLLAAANCPYQAADDVAELLLFTRRRYEPSSSSSSSAAKEKKVRMPRMDVDPNIAATTRAVVRDRMFLPCGCPC